MRRLSAEGFGVLGVALGLGLGFRVRGLEV